jgi:hypothetical protein
MAEHCAHVVTVTLVGSHPETDEQRYDLECECCGRIGAAAGLDEAEAIARLHEQFVAVLVDAWEM